MQNARNWFPLRSIAVAALLAIPAFNVALAGDDDDKKAAPVLDLAARMQQKLSAKMNGNIDEKKTPGDGLAGELSERVDQQQDEVNQQLDAQASALTSADRGGDDEDEDDKKQAAEEAAAEDVAQR